MNWLAKLLSLIPVIVAGIEHIHGDAKSGAEKKQLALESLQLANGVAGAVLPPADHPAAGAAMQLVSSVIDGVSAIYQASKPAPPIEAARPTLPPPIAAVPAASPVNAASEPAPVSAPANPSSSPDPTELDPHGFPA